MRLMLFAVATLAGVASVADGADVLWDNNVITNGFNGRAISPPVFPYIRVVDDIHVRKPGWIVDTIRAFIEEDFGFRDGGTMNVYIYHDKDGMPGPHATTFSGLSFTKVRYGPTYFGRPWFIYSINVGGEILTPGRYWIGMRNANATGSGTNYWLTSDGGPDGGGSNTGYFSLNAGDTWLPEGFGWQHAFVIEGRPVPEPAAFLVLGAGLATLAARRRRK